MFQLGNLPNSKNKNSFQRKNKTIIIHPQLQSANTRVSQLKPATDTLSLKSFSLVSPKPHLNAPTKSLTQSQPLSAGRYCECFARNKLKRYKDSEWLGGRFSHSDQADLSHNHTLSPRHSKPNLVVAASKCKFCLNIEYLIFIETSCIWIKIPVHVNSPKNNKFLLN